MILSRIEIENYKQFLGSHSIPIPSQATVGVIGVNGVGKTTLFEAIEWCLYNPSSIPNKDVRPRGFGGMTKVTITLEHRDGTRQVMVERELKRATTNATVYTVLPDGDLEVVVQGTRQVTEYVTTKLIGLPHSAFVSTFFTRQKELHFFGNLGDSARRREVGRLLGLETIRLAQQGIGEERKRAGDESDILRRQYEEQSSGRNFAEEISAGETAVKDGQIAVIEAAAKLGTQSETLTAAEISLSELQKLRDQDVALGGQLSIAEGEHRASQQHQGKLAGDIARLRERELERTTLAPLAATRDQLQSDIDAQEALRSRFLAGRERTLQARELESRRRDLVSNARSIVQGIPTPDIEGWCWDERDATDPVTGIRRLLGTIGDLDVAADQTRQVRLVRAHDRGRSAREAAELLKRYQRARQTLDTQLEEMIRQGDPDVEIRALERERESAQQQSAQLAAQQTNVEAQRDQARRLITSLENSHFGDVCPTCARPFSQGEVDIVVSGLRARIDVLNGEVTGIVEQAKLLGHAIADGARRRETLVKHAQEIVNVRGRISASQGHLNDQETAAKNAQDALDTALAVCQLEQVPSPEQIAAAQRRTATLEQMVNTRDSWKSLNTRLSKLIGEQERLRAELGELGDVKFDDQQYRQVVIRFQEANRAAATVEQIDRDLTRMPELVAELASEREREVSISALLAKLAADRAGIGFAPDQLVRQTQVVHEARQQERARITAHHDAQSAMREAEHRKERVESEQQRIKALADRADARRKDYDQFDQMYREFTEFERYAANRLTPLLSDTSSELVRVITDGKYERVEFDGNFGIRVYDGDEESFSLDTFSGGERDAITLAARLALSRLIGSQATNQPGFLVLDEVFGSLDRDRRMRLLDLLGSIAETFDDFQQVFIISHVDDVRTSTVFNELWRIDETDDGMSRLRVLSAGEDIDDI